MEVTEFDAGTVERLKPLFPEEASLRNPLDMIASATPKGYRAALDAILSDPGVDSALAIFVPPLGVRQADVAEAIAKVAVDHPAKPVMAVLMGRQGLPQGRAELHEAKVPAYIFPESAARSLAALCRYRDWTQRPDRQATRIPVDQERAAALLAAAEAEGRTRLSETGALELLEAYGIRTAPASLARTEEEAVRLAAASGYPVVMKIVAPTIIHKTDVGGVRVDLGNEAEVRQAFDEIMTNARRAAPAPGISGVLVQRMIRGGQEMIAGVSRDPSLGPLLMFGLGGVYVEALGDVVFRLVPIAPLDAADMVRGIRGMRLLQGVRGQAPADLAALEDTLLRVSQLAQDFPQIEELDINPLLARSDGAVALDGRVLIGTAGRQRP